MSEQTLANSITDNHSEELPHFPFSSNAIRLNGMGWIWVGIVIGFAYFLIPGLWCRIESVTVGTDYRIPYTLSEDYWTFNRFCKTIRSENKVFVVGDSVIWGEYVTPEQTLSHFLNKMEGSDRYANMGVNGIHPMALDGLLNYYGSPISHRDVILHCNPLWMSSPRHDLQIEKEFNFNHPKLVPQFSPWIPCYRATVSERLGIVIERSVSFFGWSNHLRVAYFSGQDIPSWSLDHPYAAPWKQINEKVLQPDQQLRHKPVSWTESGITRQDFPWVGLSNSLQWKAVQRALDTLKKRENRIFVLVGPFNEHMLSDKSRETYHSFLQGMETWLKDKQFDYFIPDVLPSELYADASHPLKEGYEMWADRIYHNEKFLEWQHRQIQQN